MNVRIASSWWERAWGLLRKDRGGEIVVLIPCADVHTCFMCQPIDLAFVGGDGKVRYVERGVAPWRRRHVRGAAFALERIASKDAWFEVGEQLLAPDLTRRRAGAPAAREGENV